MTTEEEAIAKENELNLNNKGGNAGGDKGDNDNLNNNGEGGEDGNTNTGNPLTPPTPPTPQDTPANNTPPEGVFYKLAEEQLKHFDLEYSPDLLRNNTKEAYFDLLQDLVHTHAKQLAAEMYTVPEVNEIQNMMVQGFSLAEAYETVVKGNFIKSNLEDTAIVERVVKQSLREAISPKYKKELADKLVETQFNALTNEDRLELAKEIEAKREEDYTATRGNKDAEVKKRQEEERLAVKQMKEDQAVYMKDLTADIRQKAKKVIDFEIDDSLREPFIAFIDKKDKDGKTAYTRALEKENNKTLLVKSAYAYFLLVNRDAINSSGIVEGIEKELDKNKEKRTQTNNRQMSRDEQYLANEKAFADELAKEIKKK